MLVLHAAGVRALRVSIGWDGLEPTRDKYDWTFWDSFMDIAVRENGIRVLPYVAYTPRWNSTGGPDDYWKSSPRSFDEFAETMNLLASRYRDRVDSWEIWNEPDNGDFWLGGVDAYAKLVLAGAPAIHRANPKAHVVLGGIAGHPEFLDAFLDGPAASLVDTVNVHAYFETWNESPIETIPDYVRRFSDSIARHGDRKALWMAEVGYSDRRTTGEHVSYAHTPEYQAVVLVRTFALLLAKPEITLVAWYEVKDPPPGDAMIGDDNNRHLGVLFSDYQAKPALGALRFVTDLFSGGFEPIEPAIEAPRLTAARAFLLRDGRVVLIAWMPTGAEGTVPVVASLPIETVSEGTFYTATGARRGSLQFHREGGRSTSSSWELRAGEVAVLVVNSAP
jgi:hypothetical protein